MTSFFRLLDAVTFLMNTTINNCGKKTLEHLMAHIEAQKSFMNTRHPQFKDNTYDGSAVPYLPAASYRKTGFLEDDNGYPNGYDTKTDANDSDPNPDDEDPGDKPLGIIKKLLKPGGKRPDYKGCTLV